ncbi:MAG: hypothetical protein ACK55I_42065, partial [bacterium]
MLSDILDKNDDGVINVADIDSGDDGDGILNPGEVWALSGDYEVSQSDVDARGNYDGPDTNTINDNMFRNFVSVTATASDQTVSDDDFIDTPLLYTPELAITKVANVSQVDAAGDEILYTVTVENRGNVTL